MQLNTVWLIGSSIEAFNVERINVKGWVFVRGKLPDQFSIAFGGGASYLPEFERIWDLIRERKPRAMLMLGDNVYIDDPWRLDMQRYCYYRRHSRPEWRRLAATVPVHGIWDDHGR